MTVPSLSRLLVPLAFTIFVATSCGVIGKNAQPPLGSVSPLSLHMPMASTALLGWDAIGHRVHRGVKRGVRSFRLGAAQREDVIATAMERAWKAFSRSEEPIRNPEAWGKQIAERAGLDELRRQKRDRLRAAIPIDIGVEPALPPEQLAGPPNPYDAAVEAERRVTLRSRVATWPQPERDLALLLLDGHAETVTAAARLYRAAEERRSGHGTMYPQRARLLLEARRSDLEDLT